MQNVAASLSASLIERDAEVNAILLAAVAGEHVLFVGPPGTAKSHVCRSFARCIDGLKYFEVLLSPSLDPDEVFGPIDPIEYRETGRYVHRDENYFTKAHFAFLDEVLRSSDAVLDKLLHALGPERQATIDGEQVSLPLLSCVGATNTWPDSAHQQAFFDRWLIRRSVRPVSAQGRERLMFDDLPPVQPVVALKDLQYAQGYASALPISDAAKQAMMTVIEKLHAEGIRPSDRRCRKSMSVARAAAYLDGAAEVQPHHLECLGDVLWDQPPEAGEYVHKAAAIITQIVNPVGARINELLTVVDQLASVTGGEAQLESINKLKEVEAEASKLVVSGNGRATKLLAHIKAEKMRLAAAFIGSDAVGAAQLFKV